MRDPNRLDSFYEELKNIHKEYFSDWRFMQFMCNFSRWLMNECMSDGFYLEEKKALERIREFAEKTGYVEWI